MCNLFNLYLLVLFHLLKVFFFLMYLSLSYLLHTGAQKATHLLIRFTDIQRVETALELVSN